MYKKSLHFGLVLILAALLSACGVAAAQSEEPSVRTLSVNGSATISLAPDIAYISVGVQSENPDAAIAISDNNQKAAQVVSALKAAGVAERDIRTSNFSIYPYQDYTPQGEPREIKYIVNNTVSVTLRNLGSVGSVLNAAVDAGSNSIHGIQFDLFDKSAAMTGARRAAVDNAKAMAEEMASAAGVQLGPIQSISFSSGYPSPVYERDMAVKEIPAGAVPISTGELTFTVDVYIVYEIR
jgi:uncharacterized protein